MPSPLQTLKQSPSSVLKLALILRSSCLSLLSSWMDYRWTDATMHG